MSEDPADVQGNLRAEEIRTNVMRYLSRDRRQNETETTEPRAGTVAVLPGNDQPAGSEMAGNSDADV